jgi:hypothetical protein
MDVATDDRWPFFTIFQVKILRYRCGKYRHATDFPAGVVRLLRKKALKKPKICRK